MTEIFLIIPTTFIHNKMPGWAERSFQTDKSTREF